MNCNFSQFDSNKTSLLIRGGNDPRRLLPEADERLPFCCTHTGVSHLELTRTLTPSFMYTGEFIDQSEVPAVNFFFSVLNKLGTTYSTIQQFHRIVDIKLILQTN